LNLESDSESDDEVDNTKEIQIEEALKLYQSALKYHSEGPRSYQKAKEAYEELFKSEIFKYAESLSEYSRSDVFGDSPDIDYALIEDVNATGSATISAETAPNTLPQILHLAYKNHGQLIYDILVERENEFVRIFQEHQDDLTEQARQITQKGEEPLKFFAEALDKDEADVELWSQTASLANFVSSKRLARFCLEAVLDKDDESLEAILQLPGIQETFALKRLKQVVQSIEDDLSMQSGILRDVRNDLLSTALMKRFDTSEFDRLTPILAEQHKRFEEMFKNGPKPTRLHLRAVTHDWAAVGDAILSQFLSEQKGFQENSPGAGITISFEGALPFPNMVTESKESLTDTQHQAPITTEALVTSPLEESKDAILISADTTAHENQQNPVEIAASPVGTRDNYAINSRKRSTESAGLPETADGARVRSKRIRARESIAEAGNTNEAPNAQMAQEVINQLWNLEQADQFLFTIAGDLFGRLRVEGLGTSTSLRALFQSSSGPPSETPNDSLTRAAQDLFNTLQCCTQKSATLLTAGESVDQLSSRSRESGLNAFLGMAKSNSAKEQIKPKPSNEGLQPWIDRINSDFLTLKEVAFEWIRVLLQPGAFPLADKSTSALSSYIAHQWSDDLKRVVVQIIVNMDEHIYKESTASLAKLNSAILTRSVTDTAYQFTGLDSALLEYLQTLFELHLDIYSLIKHPGSRVDPATQTSQKDRLERWALLARDALSLRKDNSHNHTLDCLALRHIWASTFHVSVCGEASREHIMYCMEDLRSIVNTCSELSLQLQNNAIMPELTDAAVARELTRLSMRDYFLKVFSNDDSDPAATIENIEPIIEPSSAVELSYSEESGSIPAGHITNGKSEEDGIEGKISSHEGSSKLSPIQEMRKFLETASTSVRLSLWQRLREAYETIDYAPKVVSCFLRSIELIMSSFGVTSYKESQEDQRHTTLLSGLRLIDEILIKLLAISRIVSNFFDALDEDHLRSSMSAIAKLLRLLSATNIYEDLLRVGLVTQQALPGRAGGNVNVVISKLHDMYVRAWCLQYLLLRESINQAPELFKTPSDDRFEILRHIHYAVGERQYSHAASRWLLRLLKDEMLELTDITDTEARDVEMAQVLYDLYGLKCFADPSDCMEYDAPPDILERKTASQLLDFVMEQAQKVSMKDLPKMELKATIDKVHGALGRPKAVQEMAFNRKVLGAYLKSPIQKLDLYRCLNGIGSLPTVQILPNRAIAASKGWYCLMGTIALSKFRSQKRAASGPTEDINFAAAFFMQDLEYSSERWETWYRLAQTHDTHIEDLVSWNAEKAIGSNHELIQHQRAAIHCYTMAVACAERRTNDDEAAQTTSTELYSDFGTRIYASSREPFSMQAFEPKETELKFYSGDKLVQAASFISLDLFTAWKYASSLFKRAIRGNPDRWWNHYMLGKCLWKMHTASDEISSQMNKPTSQDVIEAFTRAIEVLPRKDGRKEPVLEPHYKLVSIVHKLVQRKELSHAAAGEILQTSHYLKDIDAISDTDEWGPYVLQVLKTIRTADKSGWHHRMTARAARIIYNEASTDYMAATGAKQELTQQIFTKTMAIQVWKPENERPGRHFVYTTRYTRFFLQLLTQLNDRPSLEALAKRVRKKPAEFFEHTKLWMDLYQAYLRMLRRAGPVPEGLSDTVFKSKYNDEIATGCDRLEAWCHASHPDPSSPASNLIEILRETLELKRLNNKLWKDLVVDDLIEDTYAMLYQQVVPTLDPLPTEKKKESDLAGSANVNSSKPMSLGSITNVDGSTDGISLAQALTLAHQGSMDLAPQQPPDHSSRSRKLGIGRRELQKRAEAAVNRPAAPALPIRTPSTPVPPQAGQVVQVVLPQRAPERRLTITGNGADSPATNDESFKPDEVHTAENSAPASVHDSADDESELSEPEDEDEEEEEQHEEDGEDHEDEMEEEDEGGDVRQLHEENERERPRTPSPYSKAEGITDTDHVR
jgi:hypothetical protein